MTSSIICQILEYAYYGVNHSSKFDPDTKLCESNSNTQISALKRCNVM
jgi:hypothetical protein